MRRTIAIRQSLAAVGFLFAVLALVAHCAGCSLLASRVAPAVDVAQYKASLDECREEGKRRKSYAVYEQCAVEVDTRYGLDGGAK